MVVVFCMVLIAGVAAAQSPSGAVSCNLVDKAIGKISAGDGVSPVTNAETGPGGWRFNSVGRSFVTFAHTLNDNGTPGDPSDDFYDVFAGRSNVAGNAGIINNYPIVLDLPQLSLVGAMVFPGRRGRRRLDGGSDQRSAAVPAAGLRRGTGADQSA